MKPITFTFLGGDSFSNAWVCDGNVQWCESALEKIIGAPVKTRQRYAIVRKDEYDVEGFKGKPFTIRFDDDDDKLGVTFRGLRQVRYAPINGRVGERYLKLDKGVSLLLLDLSVYELD